MTGEECPKGPGYRLESWASTLSRGGKAEEAERGRRGGRGVGWRYRLWRQQGEGDLSPVKSKGSGAHKQVGWDQEIYGDMVHSA